MASVLVTFDIDTTKGVDSARYTQMLKNLEDAGYKRYAVPKGTSSSRWLPESAYVRHDPGQTISSTRYRDHVIKLVSDSGFTVTKIVAAVSNDVDSA